MTLQVLGVAGSLRRDSHNRKLLRAAAAQLPPGVQFTSVSRPKTSTSSGLSCGAIGRTVIEVPSRGMTARELAD